MTLTCIQVWRPSPRILKVFREVSLKVFFCPRCRKRCCGSSSQSLCLPPLNQKEPLLGRIRDQVGIKWMWSCSHKRNTLWDSEGCFSKESISTEKGSYRSKNPPCPLVKGKRLDGIFRSSPALDKYYLPLSGLGMFLFQTIYFIAT